MTFLVLAEVVEDQAEEMVQACKSAQPLAEAAEPRPLRA